MKQTFYLTYLTPRGDVRRVSLAANTFREALLTISSLPDFGRPLPQQHEVQKHF